MCENYDSSDTVCSTVSSGILSKGLRTSIVSLVESDRDIISQYEELDLTNSTATKEGIVTIINSTKYRSIEEMILY